MGVKIDKIIVKGLGPIKNFSEQLGLFNLIYSPNELGKTFLTEFIIRSLFRNTKRWSILRKGGTGKIWLSGLEKKSIEFFPQSKNKLEDYWTDINIGLPPSMVKLLIAKGAEAAIEDTEEGINKHLVKEVLSGINILDKIDSDSNISRTIKTAQLDNRQINIKQQGEGKEYIDLKDKLNKINTLFEEIESQYSRGIIETYKIKEKELQKQLEDLNKAKRHTAYLISKKNNELRQQLNQIPQDDINQITSDISSHKFTINSYNELNEKYEEAREKSKQFQWLQNALTEYKDLTANIIKKPGNLLLYLAGVFALTTFVFILFKLQLFSIVFFITTLIFIVIYLKKYYDASKFAGHNEELNKIKKEFNNRIGKELTDIALFDTVLQEQKVHYDKAEVLTEQLKHPNEELQKLQSFIRQKLFNLTGKQIEENDWDKTLRSLKVKYNDISNQIDEEQKKLNSMGINESDFLQTDIGIKYSQEKQKKVKSELEDTREKIEEQVNNFNQLKYKACLITTDDQSISWEELIEKLRVKRQELQTELKEVNSKIIAGIIVHKVITKLRKEEDTKIQEGLESETVLQPLQDLTQHYNRLSLEGDKLLISDDYNTFNLNELSTGAREQVMLALRIGFSSKLLKQDSLFLILDDAFQHSDWEKREILITQLANVANKGWQIIYLTMDDHIKSLFDKIGKEFNKEYKSIEIGGK